MNERENFQHFLNNNWINYVIRNKSIKNDDKGFEAFILEQQKNSEK
jgi:hypothetical protein